ncbi:MAG: right-handed parallel beta-helix repeat-containing protein, partial [Anaerolineae bacterium]|nr:right-handed parallel beta-helix repeat-containing protein [Anaerolineae bacterium]
MGSTYYVSATNGNNNNPGNDPNYPLRTIQAAINKAQSGDSITVRGGTYTERLHIQKPGTAGASFAITTDPGEQAIIDGTGLDIPEDAALVVIQQSQNVSLTGLTIRNSAGCGILVGKSSQITIDGCKVEYCQAGGLFADQCDTLLVQKCDISGCARRFLADGASDTNSALGVRQSRDVTIQENLVHENSDRGIAILTGCEKVKVFRNTCYDNRNGQIGITSSVDVLIDSNLCYHTGNAELLTLQGQRGPGITKHDLAQYRTGGMWHTRNVRVVNNYIVGCGVGFQTSRTGGQLTDFQLAHNTILNSTESLLDINVINAG